MRAARQDIILAISQTAVSLGLLLLPSAIIYTFTGEFDYATTVFLSLASPIGICYLIFMINYWWLVPQFSHKGKYIRYIALNLCLAMLIIGLQLCSWPTDENNPMDNVKLIYVISALFIGNILFFFTSASLAFALRNSRRTKALKEQMQEEKRRHAEAELVWLKNQLNPHFLFNTLNNISALVAFDADRAQDSISNLSDLLRYAIYESSKPSVPLEMEVNFMKDYISLMSLRCSDKTIINTDFYIESGNARIAPLLLISIIENAFKHGVSANRPSVISISMIEKGGVVSFSCSNTNYAKGTENNSGSGIGLTNMQRRLDLLYSKRYEWSQNTDEQNFNIFLKIEL